VKDALLESGIEGMTILERVPWAPEGSHRFIAAGEYTGRAFPKVKISWWSRTIGKPRPFRLSLAARTGRIGDGANFVSRIEEAIRIPQ